MDEQKTISEVTQYWTSSKCLRNKSKLEVIRLNLSLPKTWKMSSLCFPKTETRDKFSMFLISYARDKWVFVESKQKPGAHIIIPLAIKQGNNDQKDTV